MRQIASTQHVEFAMPQNKQYADVKAVARRYDCHPSTIWRMVKSGQLPEPVKIGNLTRWELGALDAADAHIAA